MSKSATARRIRLGYPKGPDGKPVCRWCRGPVPKGRQCWCGQKCVEEYRARNDPGFIRRKVWERDQGICQVCGLDIQALKAHIWEMKSRAGRLIWPAGESDKVAGSAWDEYRAWLVRVGFRRWWERGGLWQADHRLEVAAGGAELGLQNLQVCCTVCHRRKTAEFAAKRALERRQKIQPELAIA
jgi:5-methylcytosine-specific restriction protein A